MKARNNKANGTGELWDVAVIGGGAAGMIAAGVAAAHGAKVVLIEKNKGLGKKLLITGGGRCNVTNAEFDTRALLAKFNTHGRKNDQFLFSAFAKFGVQDTLDFFNSRGMETKVEALQRVFPTSDRARSVWEVLASELQINTVRIMSGATVAGLSSIDGAIDSIQLADGQKVRARTYIIATGGKSRPETGSTGEGFEWLRALGHTIRESDAALVPVTLSDEWKKEWLPSLSGLTLQKVQLTVLQDGIRQARTTGRLLFTHVGVSGPAILNLSKVVGGLLAYGPVTITVDLFPDLDQGTLDAQVHSLVRDESNKKVKNVLSALVPSGLVPVLLKQIGSTGDEFAHSFEREKRIALVQAMKALPLPVKGLLGLDKAVVTSGGVALTEVDFRTMQSRLIPNLYLVGDVLDIDRPSGGYSLQLCWTTGSVAGRAAASASHSPSHLV